MSAAGSGVERQTPSANRPAAARRSAAPARSRPAPADALAPAGSSAPCSRCLRACRTSSSAPTPLSNCSFVIRYDSCAVFIVFGDGEQVVVRPASSGTDRQPATPARSPLPCELRPSTGTARAPGPSGCGSARRSRFPTTHYSDRIRRSNRRSKTTDTLACALRLRLPTASSVGKQLRAGDLVLRARRVHIQQGHAQIAVVLQRDLDDLLQPRIGEEFAPADVGTRRLRRADRVASRRRASGCVVIHAALGNVCIDGRRRALVLRLERAASSNERRRATCNQGMFFDASQCPSLAAPLPSSPPSPPPCGSSVAPVAPWRRRTPCRR